jgi:hypothetical protein
MIARTHRSLFVSLLALAAVLAASAAARADDVVAAVPRDTPIAAYGGVVAWSDYDAATGSYRLVVRRGEQVVPLPVPAARRPFDVSLGPDAHGRVVALYTRCRAAAHGCDIYRYALEAARERRLAVSSPTADEAWPVQWRDRVAFVRRARARVPDPVLAPGRPGARGPRVPCDVPYVSTRAGRAPARRLARGLCGETIGLSIRGERIVQTTSFYVDFNAAETQVRRLSARGGAGRVLARAPGGLGGYSVFTSPTQSASAVWLTRTGNREPLDFVRIDLASGRLAAVRAYLPLAGRVALDDRGTLWYVQAPEPPQEFYGEPPFCTSALEPCRLVRASANPFSAVTRALPPRLRLFGPRYAIGPFSRPVVISGDLTRAVVRRGAIVRREPLRSVPVELVRSAREAGPFAPSGLETTTDETGRWSFSLGAAPEPGYVAAVARALGVASPSFDIEIPPSG